MRLIAVVTQKSDPDMTWNLINQATWAVVEVNFAIISGMSILELPFGLYPSSAISVIDTLLINHSMLADFASCLAGYTPERPGYKALRRLFPPTSWQQRTEAADAHILDHRSRQVSRR